MNATSSAESGSFPLSPRPSAHPVPPWVITDLFQGFLQHREGVGQGHRLRVLGTHPHRGSSHFWSQGTCREHHRDQDRSLGVILEEVGRWQPCLRADHGSSLTSRYQGWETSHGHQGAKGRVCQEEKGQSHTPTCCSAFGIPVTLQSLAGSSSLLHDHLPCSLRSADFRLSSSSLGPAQPCVSICLSFPSSDYIFRWRSGREASLERQA